MGPLQVEILEADGDGVSRSGSDVPAAVQSGRILKWPTRAGDDTTGGPKQLHPLPTGVRNPGHIDVVVPFRGSNAS